MATNNIHASVGILRAISYRISSTPTEQLPQIATQIASQLWQCKHILGSSPDQLKQIGDASVIVHRFKTHLSTLLQDRSVQGRWSAVVLVKATIEAGGVETLSKSNAWVRNLLGILKKHDPPTTRVLAVIVLTRIFMLTWDHTNLVREITTPALPAFVATCINNADISRCSPTEFQTILESFITLIPRHHTTFRTYESQIRSLASAILSTSLSAHMTTIHFTQRHRALARHLLTLLHHCSPKQSSAGKWDEKLKSTITAAHATCDRVFRAVIEDWQSNAGVQSSIPPQILFKGEPELDDSDLTGLSGWKGVIAGSERLVTLLEILQVHIETITAAPVTFRIGLVTDILMRVLSLAAPRPGMPDSNKANSQVSKDERDALYSVLPGVHIAAFKVIGSILDRYANIICPIMQSFMAQIVWIFQAESSEPALRAAAYLVLQKIFEHRGPIMAKEDVADAEIVVNLCCDDLAADDKEKLGHLLNVPASTVSTTVPSSTFTCLETAARSLLIALCRNIEPANMTARSRTQMERTAILTENREALTACVFNLVSNSGHRGRTNPSLIPLLARRFPNACEVEAFLRPRMPALRQVSTSESGDQEEDIELRETRLEQELRRDSRDHLMTDNDGQPTALLDPFDQLATTRQTEDEGLDSRPSIQQSNAFNMGNMKSEKRQSPAMEASSSHERPEKRLRISPTRELRSTQRPVSHGQPPKLTAPVTQSSTVEKDDDESDFEIPALTMDQDTDEDEE